MGGTAVRRRANTAVPSGQMVESLEFYRTSVRIGADGAAAKDLVLAFEAKAQVTERENVDRSFRHVNVENEEITHIMKLAYREEFRDELLIRWRFDLFTVTRSAEVLAQGVKYLVLGCRRNGDVLLEASKA